MAETFEQLMLLGIFIFLGILTVNSLGFIGGQSSNNGLINLSNNTKQQLANINYNLKSNGKIAGNILDKKTFKNNNIAKQPTQKQVLGNISSQGYTISNISSTLTSARTQLGGIEANPRTTIFNLESDVPLTEYRNDWHTNNQASVGWNGHEYWVNASGQGGKGILSTSQYGEYSPGYVGQVGIGTRIPKKPTGNSYMNWGYYNANDGFYFGVNSTCTYVALKRGGKVQQKVCQKNWNVNTLNTTKKTKSNPSGYKLSLAEGNIYEFEYTWYGYGQVTAEVVIDRPGMKEKVVPVQRFDPQNTSSIYQVNLPINTTVKKTDSVGGALKMFIGGRQYSIEGQNPVQSRENSNTVGSKSINSTHWTPIMSFRSKSSLKYIRLNVLGFDSLSNCEAKYQVRQGTSPNNPNWHTPSNTHASETSVEVDTQSTSISNSTGGLTGYKITGGLMPGGGGGPHSKAGVGGNSNVNTVIGAGKSVTLIMESVSTSCNVDATTMRWRESW